MAQFELEIPARVPEGKQRLLKCLVHELQRISGVVAITLGGSYARGTQHEQSDLDLGLYYFEAEPPSIAAIQSVAKRFSNQETPIVTTFYEWGPWVNGGAWISTEVGRVDFLYRNLNQVAATIADAQQGIVHHHYNQQPAYGFYSVIYLAEIHFGIPLYDPDAQIQTLKHQVEIYPAKLKERTIVDPLWLAEFTLILARKFAAAADVYNTVGCLTCVATNLTQVLFALNETYFMSDKKAMDLIEAFPVAPTGYVQTITKLLAHSGETSEQLSQTIIHLTQLWQSVVAIAGNLYQPKYQF